MLEKHKARKPSFYTVCHRTQRTQDTVPAAPSVSAGWCRSTSEHGILTPTHPSWRTEYKTPFSLVAYNLPHCQHTSIRLLTIWKVPVSGNKYYRTAVYS